MKKYLGITLVFAILAGCTGRQSNKEKMDSTPEERIPEVRLEKVWETDTVMRTPEATLFDEQRNVIYVSNIDGEPSEKDGNGFISRMKPDGTILDLKWITGLNAPKGLGVYKNFLYVADINEIVIIEIMEGKVVEIIEVEGAVFLNDITVDENGLVYISDSEANNILLLKNMEVSPWLGGDLLNRPNGLYWQSGKMMLASSGHEQFKEIDMSSKKVSILSGNIGHGDGIAKDSKGNYIVSNWHGQIFYIYGDGRKIELLNTQIDAVNSADIDLIIKDNLLLVPTFFDNRIIAYRIVYG